MLKPKIPLWAHQKDAVEAALKKQNFAFFLDIGTGKSCTTINTLRNRFQENGRAMRTIILCPGVVVPNWYREIGLHSNAQPITTMLQGSYGTRLRVMKAQMDDLPGGHIFICNYESLLDKDLLEQFLAFQPEVLVFDESHLLKNYKAVRTKAATTLAFHPSVRHRYILSGTPILNSPMDLFSQYYCMDKGVALGSNFFEFRARYFIDKNAGMNRQKYFPNWQPNKAMFPELNKIIAETSFKAKKSECLDLPPLVKKKVEIEMGKQQSSFYSSMRKEFMVEVRPDAVCVATLAITKGLRLQQIASGFIPAEFEDGKTIIYPFKENPRAQALRDLLEQIPETEKVIIWAVFKENYVQIREVLAELGIEHVEVTGDIPQKERQKNIDLFNTPNKTRVFLGHPKAGGIGINLTAASYTIVYSRGFSLGDDLQSEGRFDRGGSEEFNGVKRTSITRIDLVAKDSIDELVAISLANKEEVGSKILYAYAGSLKHELGVHTGRIGSGNI